MGKRRKKKCEKRWKTKWEKRRKKKWGEKEEKNGGNKKTRNKNRRNFFCINLCYDSRGSSYTQSDIAIKHKNIIIRFVSNKIMPFLFKVKDRLDDYVKTYNLKKLR